MISDRDLVALQREGSPFTHEPVPRAHGEASLARLKQNGADMARWSLLPVDSCRVCGEPAWANLRCTKHQDRNPCCVEGCKRSIRAEGRELRDDQCICGEHWRRYVPARSLLRRTYNRHWQLAKRYGWDDARVERFERLWDALVRRVRRYSTEGAIDEKAIRAMFGWDDEAG